MNVVKIRCKTGSKVEMGNLLITTYCIFKGIKLGNTDIDVLAYLSVYGFRKSTKQLILSSRILNSSNSLENSITRLRKKGLIIRDRDGENMVLPILTVGQAPNMGMMIKLENI